MPRNPGDHLPWAAWPCFGVAGSGPTGLGLRELTRRTAWVARFCARDGGPTPSHVSDRGMRLVQASDLVCTIWGGAEACGLAVGRRPQTRVASLETVDGGRDHRADLSRRTHQLRRDLSR